jgi:hypothetical protein
VTLSSSKNGYTQKTLWSQAEWAQLESFPLAVWATQRRQVLLELLDRQSQLLDPAFRGLGDSDRYGVGVFRDFACHATNFEPIIGLRCESMSAFGTSAVRLRTSAGAYRPAAADHVVDRRHEVTCAAFTANSRDFRNRMLAASCINDRTLAAPVRSSGVPASPRSSLRVHGSRSKDELIRSIRFNV